jgi:simple sugar transport system ATP-binding protein
VELRGIHKRFGAVRALDGADLVADAGEVHGVLGENGAGKTTLLSILAGGASADAGTVRLHGEPVRFRTPREAWAAGVGMVHQHFALVPRLTVLENLALGRRGSAGRRARGGPARGGRGSGPARRPERWWALRLDQVRARAEQVARSTGLQVPFDRRVEELGVGDRQRAEILKVLLREPRVLVLDEPTAVLTPTEVESLIVLLRRLAGQGRAVLLVAHKLDEVLAVADRVTVLRAGRTVLRAHRLEVDAPLLARAMVGGTPPAGSAATLGAPSGTGLTASGRGADRDPPALDGDGPARPTAVDRHSLARNRQAPASSGERVATLEGVTVLGSRGEPALREVALDVHRGEIVGVAGVEGNGQHELARVLAGRLAPTAGRARVPEDPGYVPQDRAQEGLIGSFTIAENLALAWQRDPERVPGAVMDWDALRAEAERLIARFDIRVRGADTLAGTLSGGSQQRVVVARELSGRPDLLVVENPTRGLDVAGAGFVHRRLRELRGATDAAPGIVLISTDLDEVLHLADRVLVLVRGRLAAVPDAERTREGVGRVMLAGQES